MTGRLMLTEPVIARICIFLVEVECFAPATLAAGPERMVSTGRCLAMVELINVPSPFTTTIGA